MMNASKTKDQLTWSHAYTTQVREIDQEHKLLIKKINNLLNVIKKQSPDAFVDMRFIKKEHESLKHEILLHFLHEERLMEFYHISVQHRSRHLKEHLFFIQQLNDISSKRCADFVKWVINGWHEHLIYADKELGRLLCNINHTSR